MPYIGNTPNSVIYKSKRETYVYTSVNGQVTYTGADNAGETLYLPEFGEALVFLDGVLIPPSSFSITNNTITLGTAPAVGTEVMIITELESALVDAYTRQETENAITNRLGTWETKTADFTAFPQGKFFIDTTTTAITVTMPASPEFGDEVKIVDIKGNSKTNPITLARNGKRIMGTPENLIINSNRAALGLVYFDASEGWVLTDK